MINKILRFKAISFLVILLISLLFSLSIGKEYLHNHKPNEFEGDDCPALIISQTFSSGITVYFELPHFQIVEFYFDITNHTNHNKPKLQRNNLRAPPIV